MPNGGRSWWKFIGRAESILPRAQHAFQRAGRVWDTSALSPSSVASLAAKLERKLFEHVASETDLHLPLPESLGLLVVDYAVPAWGISNVTYRLTNIPGGADQVCPGELEVPYCLGWTFGRLAKAIQETWKDAGEDQKSFNFLHAEFRDAHDQIVMPSMLLDSRFLVLVALVEYKP